MKKYDALFIGDNNCMMFAYARELRKKGLSVLYYVTYNTTETLHRPELQYYDISYPYPEWIQETPIKSKLQVALLPWYYAKYINKYSPKVTFLSGYFISTAPYLNTQKIILIPHGTEATVTFDDNAIANIEFKSKNKIVKKLKQYFVKKVYKNMKYAFEKSNMLVYYPKGLTPSTDRVISECEKNNIKIIHRLDMSEDLFLHLIPKEIKLNESEFKIISPVRFFFTQQTIKYAQDFYKGNDIIIKALYLFKQKVPNFKCIFFEKGEDVDEAKRMIKKLNLEINIIWEKEVPLKRLVDIYTTSDVCIEQVGNHWVSGVGMISLFLDIPLIANANNLIDSGFWPSWAPVYNCSTEYQICDALVDIYNNKSHNRKKPNTLSLFAKECCSVKKVSNELYEYIKSI
jgi:glycosyltransferase involved in cell wall biosynthesis